MEEGRGRRVIDPRGFRASGFLGGQRGGGRRRLWRNSGRGGVRGAGVSRPSWLAT